MEDPTWETSKENVLPLKRGRSTKKLADAFLAQSEGISTELSGAAEYEKELSNARSLGSDVLDIYVRYFKWTRDQYPSNSTKSMQLLERCTAQLVSNPKYKNDPRFVQMWIEYADMVRTPGEIFTYMSSNKIGEKSSLFWMSWAFVAEKNENFNLTDQIFQKGIKKNAEPKDLLLKRYQQYQRRMARRYLNSMNADGTPMAPTAPAASGAATTATTNENIIPSGNARAPLSLLQLQQQQVPKAAAPVAQKSSKSNATFTIFSEDSEPQVPQAGRGAAQLEGMDQHENKHWKRLGSEASRRKENDGPATRWTDGGVNSAPVTAPSGGSIAVFVDEEFANEESTPTALAAVEAGTKTVMSMRRALDGPIEAPDHTDVAAILKNPLARHPVKQEKEKDKEKGKEKEKEKEKSLKPASSKSSSSSSGASAGAAPHTSVKAPALAPAVAPTPAGKFAIFSDDFDADADCGIKASTVKASKATPAAGLTSTIKASKTAFPIFSDENEPAAAVAISRPAPKTASKPQLASIPDVPAANDLMQNQSSHSMNSTGFNGTPTATINTKLAMMDIDLMFQDEEDQIAANGALGGGSGGVLGDLAQAPAPVTATPFFKKAGAKAAKKPIEPYCDDEVPASRPPKNDKNTTCDTVELRDLLRAAEEDGDDQSMESSMLERQQPVDLDSQHKHRTPAVHGGRGASGGSRGTGGRGLGSGGPMANISDIKPPAGPGAGFRRPSSDVNSAYGSRRRPRADSDELEHDDTGVFGHLAMGAQDDSGNFMASPSLNFTGTITSAPEKHVAAPAAAPSAGGFAIFQDESPVAAPAPKSVAPSRSKRTRRQNDIWSGIDDLLEDPDAAPAPAPVPAPVAVPATAHQPPDEEDWLLDLHHTRPSNRYGGSRNHKPPVALGWLRQTIISNQSKTAGCSPPPQAREPAPTSPGITIPTVDATGDATSDSSSEDSMDALFHNNPRHYHLPRLPAILVDRSAEDTAGDDGEDGEEEEDVFADLGLLSARVRYHGAGKTLDAGMRTSQDHSLHRLITMMNSQPSPGVAVMPPAVSPVQPESVSALEAAPTPGVPVSPPAPSKSQESLDELCLVEITLMNHDKFLNRRQDAALRSSSDSDTSSTSSSNSSSSSSSNSSGDSVVRTPHPEVECDDSSVGSLSSGTDSRSGSESEGSSNDSSDIASSVIAAVQSMRVADPPSPDPAQPIKVPYLVLDVKEHDAEVYRTWPQYWAEITAPGAPCADLCVDYRPGEESVVDSSAATIQSIGRTINSPSSSGHCSTRIVPQVSASAVAAGRLPACFKRKISLPSRGAKTKNREGSGKLALQRKVLSASSAEIEYTTTAIGSGAFGYCLLANIKDPGRSGARSVGAEGASVGEGGEGKVIKVDPDVAFVVWEVYIHQEIQANLHQTAGTTAGDKELASLRQVYSAHFLPPLGLWLYTDACALIMPYANAKTLLDLVNLMIRGKNGLKYDVPGSSTAEVNRQQQVHSQLPYNKDPVTLGDQECLAAYFLRQMVDAVTFMHKQHLAHCDIKPNNWVLKAHCYPQEHGGCHRGNGSAAFQIAGCISHVTVCLIDFGKAKHLRDSVTQVPVYFSGNCAADGMACPKQRIKAAPAVPGAPGSIPEHLWTVHADYHGLAACVHNLLYTEEMHCTRESVHQVVRSRGYYYDDVAGAGGRMVDVPKPSLKRHWNKLLWSNFYLTFLNCPSEADYTTYSDRFKDKNWPLLTQLIGDESSSLSQHQCTGTAQYSQKLRYMVSQLL